jgi:hypothetical protein
LSPLLLLQKEMFCCCKKEMLPMSEVGRDTGDPAANPAMSAMLPKAEVKRRLSLRVPLRER